MADYVAGTADNRATRLIGHVFVMRAPSMLSGMQQTPP